MFGHAYLYNIRLGHIRVRAKQGAVSALAPYVGSTSLDNFPPAKLINTYPGYPQQFLKPKLLKDQKEPP